MYVKTFPSQMPPNLNVPESVKTFPLKQLITDEIDRNLFIFFKIRVAKWVWEGEFVNSCNFQRGTSSQ